MIIQIGHTTITSTTNWFVLFMAFIAIFTAVGEFSKFVENLMRRKPFTLSDVVVEYAVGFTFLAIGIALLVIF